MEAATRLFASARDISRFWLPPLLDNLASLPPTLCGGDVCSIFLTWDGRMHLAATTRRETKRRLFDPMVSYTVDRDDLARAARDYLEREIVNRDAGLTGWVGAFDCVLNLKDQRDDSERRAIAERENLPFPVWSDRGGGFFDFAGPRPLLSVPMRYRNKVYGIARVHTLRADARPFSADQEKRLLDFSQQLAAFLVEGELLTTGLEHYFRIWAAEDGAELARRITDAVPHLFGVDCCSFFQRDGEDRFVLQYAGASERLRANPEDRRHFEQFTTAGIRRLYYQADSRSKTGLCIARQAPLLLQRAEEAQQWSIVVGAPLDDGLREFDQIGGRLINYGDSQAETGCELMPHRSHSILLVPVRDTINPRMLAAVLRVVSTRSDLDEKSLFELVEFAEGLADRHGETTRRQIQNESSQKLIEQLGKLEPESDKWGAAVRIITRALDADAATIFLRSNEGTYKAQPSYSFLNEDLIERYQPTHLALLRKVHRDFQQLLPGKVYKSGEGRTGWTADHTAVLNLKDLDDKEELKRWGVTCSPSDTEMLHPFCEIRHPGPFIAAPISLGPRTQVEGIVRALRWRDSPQGPFSQAHELILSTCTTLLAGLQRVWATRAVVISYGSKYAGIKDELCRLLKAIGIEPKHLAETPGGGEHVRLFEALMSEASAGIALVTPDIQINDGSWMPSLNVIAEIAMLRKAYDEKLLILREKDVFTPAMAEGRTCWQFSQQTGGIAPKLIDVATILRTWLNLS
jgi:hypothetical protein